MPENDRTAQHASTADRITAALFALLLGYFFVLGPFRQLWKDHWLVNDGQRGTATLIKKHWGGHGVVIYEYRVGDKVYTGQDRRTRPNRHFDLVIPGEKTVVYFSSSHPWLSALDMPRYVGIDGLPVVLLVWFIELGLINTVVNPKSSWAFGSHNRPRLSLTGQTSDSVDADSSVATGSTQPAPQFDGWDFLKDKLRLVSFGFLIVLTMAVSEIGLNAILGRR